MSMKSEQLAQSIQATQKFAEAKATEIPGFEDIINELAFTAASLKTGKLSIQIFSNLPILAQALKIYLDKCQIIDIYYQYKISDFPTITKNNYSILILKSNDKIGEQETRYELSVNQKILIGRNPKSKDKSEVIEIALPNYKKISGNHIEIKPVINSDRNTVNWEICDLNSRNGTYVNGQKLQGCKILQSDDIITLAYPNKSEKSPEFVFEGTVEDNSGEEVKAELIEGDIVCLIFALEDDLGDDDKQFIQLLNEYQIEKLYIIVNTLGSDISSQEIKTRLDEINQFIKEIKFNYSYEVVALPLQSVYPQNNTDSSNQTVLQLESDEICQSLTEFGKNHAEEIRFKQLTDKLRSQIFIIEQFLQLKSDNLKQEIDKIEGELQARSKEEWQNFIERLLKRVEEEREDFFRRAKAEINRSIKNLTSEFTQNSISNKVKSFIDTLKPVVLKEDKQVYIQLQSEDGKDLQEAMIEFCQKELIDWANEELTRISQQYGGGGLDGLVERSYQILNCIPSLSLANSNTKAFSYIDFEKSLEDSLMLIQSKKSYYEETVTKDLRGVGSIFIPGVLGALSLSSLFGGMPLVGTAVFLIAQAATELLSFVGGSLSQSDIKKYKLEEQVTKLKELEFNYYQRMAHFLCDRLLEDIILALEEEEWQFKKNVNSIYDQLIDSINELNRELVEYQKQQNSLIQDKAQFQQIKSNIESL